MNLITRATLMLTVYAAAAWSQVSPLKFSGSLRTRTEVWDWFDGAANNAYAYQGSLLRVSLGQESRRFDWQVEMALPVLLGLPSAANAGAGATYYASNDRSRNAVMLFPKQAFVRWKNEHHSVRLGRIEFIDGTEVTPADPTLASLKRDRIAHRLLGNFGFTHVMRSFDGVQYVHSTPKINFTFLGARPTRGVFQVDGWGEVNAAVYYAAVTGQVRGGNDAGEWRAFVLQSDDWRRDVLKTDNRPLALRLADNGAIRLTTLGGHYIHNFAVAGHQIDVLFWAALQTGKWGRLDQRSGAVSFDLGWQPKRPKALKPWLRAGFHHGSGDSDPNDDRHGTFYQPYPTARWYARFPFFTLMNIEDRFGALILRPHRLVTVRAEVHSLRLADRNDLWYQGGGAYQPWSFGYSGRPSNRQRALATLYDCALDYAVSRHFSVGIYVASASGKAVPASIYPQRRNASLGFLEATARF